MTKKRTPMAHVVETDESFQVQRINYITNPNILKHDKKYIEVTESVAKRIEKHLGEGMIVDIPKGAGKITKNTIVASTGNELGRKKSIAITNIQGQISQLFININFMELYEFIMINNKFSSIGVFIHKENKEEEYLKIINSGDESMIDTLEVFLETMDELDRINFRYKDRMKTLKSISESASVEEVDDIMKGFL